MDWLKVTLREQMTLALPVSLLLKSCNLSEFFVISDVELGHRKRVLPEPRKSVKAHCYNLVVQNEWIRSNLFDGPGNYRYCQACITKVYGCKYNIELSRSIDFV